MWNIEHINSTYYDKWNINIKNTWNHDDFKYSIIEEALPLKFSKNGSYVLPFYDIASS